MQGMTESLEQWGYVLLFLYSFGGGYVGLIAAGVMSALGKMDLWLAIPIACVGNIIGSTLLAYLARYQKAELSKLLSKHRRKLALSQIWLKKYGAWLIVFSKYIYGVKTLIPLAIGFSRFSLREFALVNALSCVAWALIVGLCGYYASSGVIMLLEKIDAHSYMMPLVLLCLGVGLYLLLSRASKRAQRSL